MAKVGRPSRAVMVSATPLPQPAGATLYRDGRSSVYRDVGPPAFSVFGPPSTFQVKAPLATGHGVRPYWTTGAIRLVPVLAPQAIVWAQDAARMTFSLDPVLLADTAHKRIPSTRIEIPPEIRLYLIQLLNQTLARTVDLRSHVKQAGWNVKGQDFSSLQALFAAMASKLDAYADLLAERIAILGGVARGTARRAAMQSRLPEYPDAIVDGHAHALALAERFASYATAMRGGITLAADVEDADRAAVYTDISRGVDKRLWVLEAHLYC